MRITRTDQCPNISGFGQLSLQSNCDLLDQDSTLITRTFHLYPITGACAKGQIESLADIRSFQLRTYILGEEMTDW